MNGNKLLVITGGNGYIGSNLIKQISNKNSFIRTQRTNSNSYVYVDSLDNKVSKNIFKNKNIVLIHLATFFTKNNEEAEEITNANEAFGRKVLNDLMQFNLNKIIYTNTMYAFYDIPEIRSLEYTQSKLRFSNYISKSIDHSKTKYEEIFLDNTFGNLDKRKKILPAILNSISTNGVNPIKNRDSYINLVHVLNVVQKILTAANNCNSKKSSFVSSRTINLNSIFEFLKKYNLTNEVDQDLLIYGKNKYIKDYPKIDLDGIKLSNVATSLIEELNLHYR